MRKRAGGSVITYARAYIRNKLQDKERRNINVITCGNTLSGHKSESENRKKSNKYYII